MQCHQCNQNIARIEQGEDSNYKIVKCTVCSFWEYLKNYNVKIYITGENNITKEDKKEIRKILKNKKIIIKPKLIGNK